MKNWESAKVNYLRLDRSQQLGNLASSLSRIQANLQFQDDPGDQVAFAAIEECQRLTKWTTTTLNLQASESDLNLAETLLDGGRQVSRWKYNWQQCRQDGKRREEVGSCALLRRYRKGRPRVEQENFRTVWLAANGVTLKAVRLQRR
jgi:hypothetical protein